MEDIFESTGFYYGDFFEKSSFFVVFIFIVLFFVLKYFLKKKKNNKNDFVESEYIHQNIDFLQELEKIKNKSLKKYLWLFSKFLEEKTGKTEISKMTLKEFKNLENLEEEKIFFEKIYLKIYSGENVSQIEKQEFYEQLEKFFKN